jgi:mono/diheme cytochrome c family protein
MTHESPSPIGHGSTPGADRIGRILAVCQFVVTVMLLGGIAALAYLAGLRSAGKERAPGAGEPTAVTAASQVDVQTLLKPTPELVAKGKTLFGVNCASCHGVNGFGDGPAAVALNPKPRNFHEGYWRYGGGVARIVQTVTVGSPGTAMAAFTAIPLQDRFALAHYVRTFGAKPDSDKAADLAWLGPVGGAPGAAGAPGGPPKPGPSIPIERALALLTQAPAPAGNAAVAAVSDPPRGAAIYADRCASCHGRSGEGGVRVRMLGSDPYVYAVTPSLGVPRLGWNSDPATFEKLVIEGIPGYVMPACGDLTRADLQSLYAYALRLCAQQQAAMRSGS